MKISIALVSCAFFIIVCSLPSSNAEDLKGFNTEITGSNLDVSGEPSFQLASDVQSSGWKKTPSEWLLNLVYLVKILAGGVVLLTCLGLAWGILNAANGGTKLCIGSVIVFVSLSFIEGVIKTQSQ